jgi:hypothetical protein
MRARLNDLAMKDTEQKSILLGVYFFSGAERLLNLCKALK